MADLGRDIREALLQEGLISQDTLLEALKEAEKAHESLVDTLVRLKKVDDKKMMQFLVQKFGYTSVNPGVFIVDTSILALVPKKICEKYLLLPVSRYENTLTVAFANPTNLKAVDEVHAITGLRVKEAVAEAGALRKCIALYYPEAAAPATEAPEAAEDQSLDDLVKMIEDAQDGPQQELLKVAYETPVIKLVNMLLLEGVRRKASDIFIEPWESHVRVRARVDGLLEEVLRPQKTLGPAMVSRIKVMSELDIAEHRVPQDGRFKVKMTGKEVDMRVSILPTTFGEKVCLRILDTSSQGHDMSKLGFNDKELQIIRDAARRPHGMILVTGPTGSGKTTTLYSVLKYLDKPEVNITTVEDPVEYQLLGINQVNIREHIGLTFPAALRSILRQDPDVILVGEIRDNATLDIAVKAALTGHLVLSTLHTNDAASSITRMINMGLEPFLIASTVLMISAQRLVRRVCGRCRGACEIEPSMLGQLGLAKDAKFYKGKGCLQCRQTGYSGRTVITEILNIAPEVRRMIMQGESAEKIKRFAVRESMSTLRQCALRKALAGETTLEEVIRVTSADQGLEDAA